MAEDDFEKRFHAIVDGAEAELKREGMKQAGLLLLRDAVMEVNKIPLDEGTLSGSGSVFVGQKFVGDSQNMSPGGTPTPARAHSEKIESDEVVAVVGFNTPYAARLHEHPEYEFQGEGRGAKYLEGKMSSNRRLYMQAALDSVKAGMQKGSR